jgi:hypothetical protein
MKVESATFELLPDDAPPSPWVIRIFMQGEGFEDRVAPLVATVGDVEVDMLRVSPDGAAASGLLAKVPPEGAPLRIGYLNDPELSSTDITFHLEEA